MADQAIPTQYLTYKFRLRDKCSAELSRQAEAVNVVWNYCNETQRNAVKAGRKWLRWLDLEKLTAGSCKLLNLHSHTIKRVCRRYDVNRNASGRPWLRFRGQKSLGWVPFHSDHVKVVEPGKLKFRGVTYETMHWRELPEGATIKAGSFSQDARGRWYINCTIQVSSLTQVSDQAVGVDLGLVDLATLSTGEKIENRRHYQCLVERLSVADRANKRKQARRIHARIANARKDYLHKVSAYLAINYSTIVVGNVSPLKLAQTGMAKSVQDAGWSTFRNMLSYKAIAHGGRYIEVDERMTTQICSACGATPKGRPRGIADLGIREWTCGDCGAAHDRDVNAAQNILRRGLATLAEGTTQ